MNFVLLHAVVLQSDLARLQPARHALQPKEIVIGANVPTTRRQKSDHANCKVSLVDAKQALGARRVDEAHKVDRKTIDVAVREAR